MFKAKRRNEVEEVSGMPNNKKEYTPKSKIISGKICPYCGKEKENFYGSMCTDCMSQ